MPLFVSNVNGTTIVSGSGTTVSGSGGLMQYGSGSLSGSRGLIMITGSLSVSGSNTITNYGSFVSNEAGKDYDFRVESSNNTTMLFVDGGSDAVGIGTGTPITALDIHHNPTGLSNDTGGGDVVTFGAGPGGGSTTAGKLYYLAADGQWELTVADAVATGGTQLLAIALGTTPGTHGMLIHGFFDVYTNLNGTFAAGKPVYVCPDSGEFDIDAPGDTGAIVRVVGYCTSTANVIYFNPSSTYIEIS